MDVPLGYGQTGRPPVLVMVSGYSRVISGRMLPSRRTGDLIDGHWRLLTASLSSGRAYADFRPRHRSDVLDGCLTSARGSTANVPPEARLRMYGAA